MIALYNMEGGEFKDLISGSAGTLKNGASLIADSERGGNVLYLNNDDVVSPGTGLGYDSEGQHAILAAPHVPSTDAMTISVWFKAKELRNWARVIDLGDAKAQFDNNPDRFINISPTNGEYTIGTVNVNDGGGFSVPNNRDRVFASLVSANTWIHAVLVINPPSGNPNVLYLNGTPYQSTSGGAGDAPNAATFTPKIVSEALDGLGNGLLGRSRFENNGDQVFNGWIDDVAIFDVALTADQVTELRNTSSANLNPTSQQAPVAVEPPAGAQVDPPNQNAPATETAPTPAPATTNTQTTAPRTGSTVVIMLAVLAASGFAIIKSKKKGGI